jgi:hypothetical protein
MSLYGTEGSYEEQVGSQVWATKDRARCEDLTTTLVCTTHAAAKAAMANVDSEDGSHQFLVDDFVKACVSGIHPPNNVWQAARYLVPGLIAHASALEGGVLMAVPDFGAGPTPVSATPAQQRRRRLAYEQLA